MHSEIHTLPDRETKGKIWRVIYELNSDQKIKIQKKFDLADELIVNDCLRQGKKLSGPKFTCFIDNLNCQLLAFGNKVFISNHCIIIIYGWHVCNSRKLKITD